MRLLCPLACLIILYYVDGSHSLADETQDARDFVESVGNRIVSSGNSVGLSIGVARGHEILVAEGFGLANVELDGHQFISHGGGISGFRSDLAYFLESEITIAIAANSDGVNTRVISDRIARHLIKQDRLR